MLLSATALPLAGEYTLYVLTQLAILVIASVALNLLTGFTGQVSLGHAALIAVGAYTHALLLAAGVPMLVSLVGASFICAGFGLIIAASTSRLIGPYLAIATLGFQVAVEQLLLHAPALTGGHMGLGTQSPRIFVELPFRAYAALCVLIAAGVIAVATRLANSRTGSAWLALRHSEALAASVGINVGLEKMRAFAISAALAGLAGGLSFHLADTIHPSQFTLSSSIELLVTVLIGGLGSVFGSVVGAVFMIVAAQLLLGHAEIQQLAHGALLLGFLLFEPRGLSSLLTRGPR